MLGRAGINSSDIDDVKQDFYLKLVTAMKRFDPAKGNEIAFIKTVIERYAASILSKRRAKKRAPWRHYTLQWLIKEGDDGDWAPLYRFVDDGQAKHHRGQRRKSPQRLLELQISVRAAVAKLPPFNRAIAEDLMAKSVAQIARERRCSRDTIYRAISEIREAFRRDSLEEFLDDPCGEHAELA